MYHVRRRRCVAEIGRNNNPGLLWIALTQSLLQPTVWFELAKGYGAEKLPWQAGYAARQAVRVDGGILPRVEALHLVGWQTEEIPPPLLGNGDVSETAGQIGRFRQQVTIHPGDWLTWLYLARLQEVAEGEAAAVNSLDRACSLEPIVGETLHFMGLWRLKGGSAPGAIAAFSRLLDIRPIRFGSMMYLGEALLRVGHEVAAEKALPAGRYRRIRIFYKPWPSGSMNIIIGRKRLSCWKKPCRYVLILCRCC